MPTAPPLHRPFARPTVAEYDRQRGSACARGYDRTWQRLRLQILAAEPLCRFCFAEGRLTEATDVDHILSVEQRPDLRLDPHNLRPLCHACHSARTAREQGFGR